MAENVSKADALKLWADQAGKPVEQWDVRVVESVDGKKQTQLVDRDTGSVSVAVDGEGQEVWNQLGKGVAWKIDDGVNPKEAVGPDNNEKFTTSRGVLATPTQPDALVGEVEPVEVDHRSDADKAATTSKKEK